ncbi:hypothetical protein DFP72DRAFT_914727 [Ephemerocybe angulata]|uniref:Uncharacterized protein n=1 Tax=Ephemerocybe angulata TaxID=980116 RepID=A0A8H6HLD3_9AGAR|nr:hypothetical protein DFP72DRAFT_914727 [Tulosesus angulatus]
MDERPSRHDFKSILSLYISFAFLPLFLSIDRKYCLYRVSFLGFHCFILILLHLVPLSEEFASVYLFVCVLSIFLYLYSYNTSTLASLICIAIRVYVTVSCCSFDVYLLSSFNALEDLYPILNPCPFAIWWGPL